MKPRTTAELSLVDRVNTRDTIKATPHFSQVGAQMAYTSLAFCPFMIFAAVFLATEAALPILGVALFLTTPIVCAVSGLYLLNHSRASTQFKRAREKLEYTAAKLPGGDAKIPFRKFAKAALHWCSASRGTLQAAFSAGQLPKPQKCSTSSTQSPERLAHKDAHR
jgi:hypothetical protein